MEKIRSHVIISGRVQGVFFRYSIQIEAQKLGVQGWVKNRGDGVVEAVFEGEKEEIQKLVDWCHHGPPGASVKNVEVEWQDYTGEYDSFSITYR